MFVQLINRHGIQNYEIKSSHVIFSIAFVALAHAASPSYLLPESCSWSPTYLVILHNYYTFPISLISNLTTEQAVNERVSCYAELKRGEDCSLYSVQLTFTRSR